jgi:amino acid transporter
MAEQRELPVAVSATHRRFRTPYLAILLTSAVMLALALSGTFIYAATLSAIARLLAYAGTCAALPILRKKERARPAMFKAPGGTVVAAASLLLIAWLLSSSTWREARDAAIAAAAGLLIYLAYRLYSGGRSRESAAQEIADEQKA